VGVPARGPMERLPLGVPKLLEGAASLVGVLERRIARRPAVLGQPVAARCSGRWRRCAARRRRRDGAGREGGRPIKVHGREPRRGTHAKAVGLAATLHREALLSARWPGRAGVQSGRRRVEPTGSPEPVG
jgi:hypothetical protein